MTLRALAAAFDAIAMLALAFVLTGGSFDDATLDLAVWGSAAAAMLAAIVILTRGPSALGWVAVGYILFAAFLVRDRPIAALALLALAYMPILDRPRGSLSVGLAIAIVTAAVLALASRVV